MGRCRPLSDTNLSTKWDILTNEARKVLKLGKKIGLQIEGNEEDVGRGLLIEETKKSNITLEFVQKIWYDDEFDYCEAEAIENSGEVVRAA
ncbi:hypothetical protein V6N12_046801 [Hibiscus sabdariffa]|uniref:Uncharacterized protein n=1 Tax=Hibiscus sabdariffa TaxID=183260 RepID=A0ABR1ZXV1_9ROSI